MKIVRVECHEVVVPTHPGRVNSPEYGPAAFDVPSKILLEVHTDNGQVGLGESLRAVGEGTVRAGLGRLAGLEITRLCLQEPPLADISADYMVADAHAHRPHRLLERAFNTTAHLGIHTAMLDLLGKQAGMPVYALLGGAYRDRVPVDTWMGRMTPEDSARVCRQAQEQGFRGAKMKCTLEDRNVERAAAIKEACGGEFKLTFDPNQRFYRYGEAIGMLRRLAEVGNIGCVEDPFNKNDLEGFRLLRSQGLFPVALHTGYAPQLLEALRRDAVDYCNLDGTPWDVRKAADVCWLANIPTWHGSGVDLGITEVLHLHVAAASKAMARPSDIFGRTIRRHNLITNPLAAEGGFIAVPKGPGLGVELDRDALDRHTVRRFTVEMAG